MKKYDKYLTIIFILIVGILIVFFWIKNLNLLSTNKDTENSSTQTQVQLEVTGTPKNISCASGCETTSSTQLKMEVYDSSK